MGIWNSLFGQRDRPSGKVAANDSAKLPKTWSAIQSFAVAVPIHALDLNQAERGLQSATKVRDAFLQVCRERYLRDELFNQLDRKRQAGGQLTEEEKAYVEQADTNYLEMVCDKMEVTLLYDGDFQALSPEERSTLYKLIEKYPGCSLVGGQEASCDRIAYRIDPGARLTDDEARNVLYRILR